MSDEKKKRNRRPKLRACLVYWDEEKQRYRMTTPKTAKAARGITAEAVFLLTDTLEKRDLPDIQTFRECLAASEIGACFNKRGPITYDMLQAVANEPGKQG